MIGDESNAPEAECAIECGQRPFYLEQLPDRQSEPVGDWTFKLSSRTTSGYGRYVESLWGAPWRAF